MNGCMNGCVIYFKCVCLQQNNNPCRYHELGKVAHCKYVASYVVNGVFQCNSPDAIKDAIKNALLYCIK
jgi:hypothetical protein